MIGVPTRGRVCSAEESARNERALLAPPAGKTASEAGYHECLHRQPAVDASVKDAPPRFVAYKRCPISFKTRCPKADWVDDMFAMDSGVDAAGRAMSIATADVVIENSVVRNGHGLTLGSGASGGLRNVK